MKKAVLPSGALLLLMAHFAASGPVQPFGDKMGHRQATLEPFGRETYTLKCKANERSSVIVYGQGSSPMAVYVFDAHGNCVARDDLSNSTVSDDLALEWYPPTEEIYEIEIRNLGRKQNTAEIAIR